MTAGNATGFNDGAAAMVMMSEDACERLGLEPMAYMTDYAIGTCDPLVMGLAPAYGIPKLLKRNKLRYEDIDLYECNEAFATQVLGCLKVMDAYPYDAGPNADLIYPKLNPYGSGLAIGHPLGATGARITTTALYQMVEKNLKKPVVTACIGAAWPLQSCWKDLKKGDVCHDKSLGNAGQDPRSLFYTKVRPSERMRVLMSRSIVAVPSGPAYGRLRRRGHPFGAARHRRLLSHPKTAIKSDDGTKEMAAAYCQKRNELSFSLNLNF